VGARESLVVIHGRPVDPGQDRALVADTESQRLSREWIACGSLGVLGLTDGELSCMPRAVLACLRDTDVEHAGGCAAADLALNLATNDVRGKITTPHTHHERERRATFNTSHVARVAASSRPG